MSKNSVTLHSVANLNFNQPIVKSQFTQTVLIGKAMEVSNDVNNLKFAMNTKTIFV